MFLSPLIALIGLPIAAAGIAGLMYRGKVVMAAFAVIVGVVSVVIVQPADAMFAVPALLAVLFAVVALPMIDFQVVGLVLLTVFGLAGFAHDSLILRAQGTTPGQLVSSTLDQALAQAEKSAGSSATPDALQRMREVTHVMATALPTFYFVSAFVSTIAVIAVITWAARRSGKTAAVPRLAQLDLSPYVLLPFVAGVLLVAASYSAIPNAVVLGVVGLNLVL